MQDMLVRDALVAYVADGPPSRLSSASVLAAGRRSRLRHRAALAGSSLVGVAALGAVAALLVPGLLRGPVAGPAQAGGPGWTVPDPAPFCVAAAQPAGPAGPPSETVNEKNGFHIEGTTEPAEHAEARLSCHVMSAVIRELPGAVFLRDPSTPVGAVPLQVFANTVGMPGYTAAAIVGDGRGVGTIGFGFAATYESAPDAVAACTGPCTVHAGPHGEVVTVLSVDDGGWHVVNIRVYAGRTTVFVSASNGDIRNQPVASPGEATGGAPPVGRADLPLSVEKLIEIASAPELTVFP